MASCLAVQIMELRNCRQRGAWANTSRSLRPDEGLDHHQPDDWLDFPVEMLRELDLVASEFNIRREAVIESNPRQAPDQHNIAKSGTPRAASQAL